MNLHNLLFLILFVLTEKEEKNKNVPKQTPPKKSGVVESLLADIKRISTEIEKMKFKDDQSVME